MEVPFSRRRSNYYNGIYYYKYLWLQGSNEKRKREKSCHSNSNDWTCHFIILNPTQVNFSRLLFCVPIFATYKFISLVSVMNNKERTSYFLSIKMLFSIFITIDHFEWRVNHISRLKINRFDIFIIWATIFFPKTQKHWKYIST